MYQYWTIQENVLHKYLGTDLSKIYEIDDLIPESYYCYWPQKHNGGVTGPLTTKQ